MVERVREIESMSKALSQGASFIAAFETLRADFIQGELDKICGMTWRNSNRFYKSIEKKYLSSCDHIVNDDEFNVLDLPSTGFFDDKDFPWLVNFQEDWTLILSELLEFLKISDSFEPYVQYPNTEPLDQWTELNFSPDWGVFHLIKAGRLLPEGLRQFPQTLDLLKLVPQPRVAHKSPVALISRLAPNAHIPAHVGISNTRLLVHVPLIVPDGCQFRVGAQTRSWKVGTPWVFDDTTDHEAWNNSSHNRYILIFDVWHPDLTSEERFFIESLGVAEDRFRDHFADDVTSGQ